MKRKLLFVLCSLFMAGATAQTHKVMIETNMGNMTVMLYDDTPNTTANFLKKVREGYYDGSLFGRVIPSFMIQGGAPDSKTAPPGASIGWGDIKEEIPGEIRLNHVPKKGALASPRRDDKVNPQKKSDMSMFFIVQGYTMTREYMKAWEMKTNEAIRKAVKKKMFTQAVKDSLRILKQGDPNAYNRYVRAFNQAMDSVCHHTPGARYFTEAEKEAYSTVGGAQHLYGEYTIYGEVISGLEVIDKIAELETNMADRPKTDVRMKIRIIQ